MTRRVNRTDSQGRPIDVSWDGDPASQCPGCLSENVEPLLGIGMVQGTDVTEPIVVRRMRCNDCRARWWKRGA